MNELLSALAPALAWALLDFVWQGLLVGWAAALALAALRKARPQARYAVACGALLLCAALPLAGMVERIADARTAPTTLLPLAQSATAAAEAPVAGPASVAAARLAGWEQALQTRLPLVLFLWSCGAGLLALRMAFGLAWVRRLTDPGRCQPDPQWQARVTRMAHGFGIRRAVTLGLAGDISSPVTAGWWRPVVLVPAALVSGMPAQLLEALLAHELAHIKRHDYLVNLIQSAIEILLFYHPTVWWLSNRIRIEREQIADDLAASMLGEPRRLALALSELDRFQLTTPQLAHAAHGGNLMSRIKRLVRPDLEPLNWKMVLPILGLTAACAAFYANAQTAPATSATPPKKEWSVTKGPGDIAYALVRGPERHSSTMNGSSDDFREVDALKHAVRGDFVWFREGGKAYIVQDPGVLARVIDAWAPVDRLGKQMDGYGKEMDQHSKVMDSLGKEMEVTSRGIARTGDMRAVERRMEALARQQQALGRKMEAQGREMEAAGDAERDAIRREMDQLARQMDELNRQMDQQAKIMDQHTERLDSAHKPMDAIGEKMREAGKPMEALGRKMDALGKEVDQQSRAADKVVRALLKDALGKGLAQPAPTATTG